MVANGDMALDLTRKTPNVSATLSTDVFSLDPYLASKQDTAASLGKAGDGWDTSPALLHRTQRR